jgi:hypothetical protein
MMVMTHWIVLNLSKSYHESRHDKTFKIGDGDETYKTKHFFCIKLLGKLQELFTKAFFIICSVQSIDEK